MKNVAGIWLPDTDTHFEEGLKTSPMVDGKGTYQLKKYLKAREYVKNFGLAVDVGGHVGLWSRVMAMDFRRVVAFEPLSAHRECFVKNIAGHTNVELLPFAVSDRAQTLRIHMPIDNTGHAHVAAGKEMGEECQTTVLDHYAFGARVDFLKIDVEGFELFVVHGAEALIKRDKPTIIIEQKPHGNAERYGFGQHEAVNTLKMWGAIEVAVMAGDHILRW